MSAFDIIATAILVGCAISAIWLVIQDRRKRKVLPVISNDVDEYVLAEYVVTLNTPDKGFNNQTKTLLLLKKRSSLPNDIDIKPTITYNNYLQGATQRCELVDGKQVHTFTKRVGKNTITLGSIFIASDGTSSISQTANPKYIATLDALALHLTNPYLQTSGLVNAYRV